MLITAVCVDVVGASVSMVTPYLNNSSQTSHLFGDHRGWHRAFAILHVKHIRLTHVKYTLRLISIGSGNWKGCDSHESTAVVHRTVFAPSMFIAISHLSYPVRKFSDCRIFPVAMDALPPNLVRGSDYSYGHTVNESLAVLREVEKLNLSIPLAISFSLKGVYYVPRLAQPVLTQDHQYELFQPCQDHEMPYYEDPKGLCGKKNWAAPANLPVIASNLEEKRALTYLPDAAIVTLACDGKQFNLKLNFTLAAYDVDFDYNRPCTELGFDPFSSQFSRVKVAKVVSDFFRTNYTSTTMNSNCQLLALSFSFG
ncbi:hypothetical protein HPB51_000551 [Rhipicephalus microplus]|uniref:Uncharacterized protein n=1 Tax=Rhipicephalus microplus TaxID=6941 RepID=A0A9J6E4N9_RHIMP|nr:hypothetical protein HPB51_000551 [Rhipicephalus microplus]